MARRDVRNFSAVLRTLATAVVVVTVMMGNVAEGKVCNSLDIRNHPRDLNKLRGCTVILGFLNIVLFTVDDESVYDDYSFPELTEISEYLVLYRLLHLRSLAKLFPNLSIIRGKKLSLGYSVIIFRMPHMTEIGLHNLVHIGRGSVRVDHCPNLCFVDTIDWKGIGATDVFYYNMNKNTCNSCPRQCGGYCWNEDTCQKKDKKKCHPECFGCTKENSSSDCLACRHFKYAGKCVTECPKNKVAHQYTLECIEPAQCPTYINGTWWLFNGACIDECPPGYFQTDPSKGGCEYCGESCIKVCNGTVIDRLDILEGFRGCTRINGSLDLKITDPNMTRHLEMNLGDLREITGYLKVGRSSAIKSLSFLKSLKEIGGRELDSKRYSLFVFENQNLQELWNFNANFSLKIRQGRIAFHDNPLLCMSEIEQLFNRTGAAVDKDDMVVFKHTNGDMAACNVRDLKVRILENNPTNVTLSWEEAKPSLNETIIGYAIYFKEDTGSDITTFASKEVCGVEVWNSLFISNTTKQLVDLTPYTTYGYYIKIYSASLKGEQTPIYKFTTKADDPSDPLNFQALSWTHSSLKLQWNPPEFSNGKLTYYNLYIYLENDDLPFIEQRNYCLYPHEPGLDELMEMPADIWTSSNNTQANCSCEEENDIKVFDKDISTLCQSDKYSPVDPSCTKFAYQLHDEPHEENIKIALVDNGKSATRKRDLDNNRLNQYLMNTTIPANATTFEVKNLRHFSVYVFYLGACNEKEGIIEHCSAPQMAVNRTKKIEDADNIERIDVEVKNNDAYIRWIEPMQPNSWIVAYYIEHKRSDLEHSKPISNCITRRQFLSQGNVHRIQKLLPGKYTVRVQATSLAGPGKFSEPKTFEIVALYNGLSAENIIIIVVVVLLFLGLAGFVGCKVYRRRRFGNDNLLFTHINPDYAAGDIYVEDEWEVDKNDVEILRELGSGTFGMVFEGTIRGRLCAIKTVNDTATLQDRQNFLNEGSRMKSFRDGVYITQLMGIVSRGSQPYVIMELMERGDLKSFLRQCRSSSNITQNEIYRMAAQIADGMAFLAAKKFVHRDLAARNCMVSADFTVKVGDFGMARDIYETDYYKKDTVGLLPVRWMAPESLVDGVFSSDSDVWSYGVVLWEIATLAEQPYQGLSNEQVLKHVKSEGKLPRPTECSDVMFTFMSSCWAWRPIDRPTFPKIVDNLLEHVGENFKLISYCYSQQGREHALNAGTRVVNQPAVSYKPYYDANEQQVLLNRPEASTSNQRVSISPERRLRSRPSSSTPSLES